MGASKTGVCGISRPGICNTETVDPVYLREKPEYLAEGIGGAEKEYCENKAVQPRIRIECTQNVFIQDCCEKAHEDQEYEHAGEVEGVGTPKRYGEGQRPYRQSICRVRKRPKLTRLRLRRQRLFDQVPLSIANYSAVTSIFAADCWRARHVLPEIMTKPCPQDKTSADLGGDRPMIICVQTTVAFRAGHRVLNWR